MHGVTAAPISAGWYADPAGERQLRWWDGATWTDATFPPSTPERAQVPRSADFVNFVTRDAATKAADWDPYGHGSMTHDSLLTRSPKVDAPAEELATALTHTRAAWLIALMPLMQIALAVPVFAFLPQADNFRVILLGLIVAPWLWTVSLAVRDRDALTRARHESTAHWAWAILSPFAYLVSRSIHVRRAAHAGSAPLWAWVASSAAQLAAATLLAGVAAGIMSGLFSAEVAKNVESSIAREGSMVTVGCPADAPLAVGGAFQCAVTHDTGRTYTVNVHVTDLLGGFTWRLTEDVAAAAPRQQ